MTKYYYLDVSLYVVLRSFGLLPNLNSCSREFGDYKIHEITDAFFKKHVIDCVKTLFGEVSAAVPVDLLKYNYKARRGILRVPIDSYVKLHSSLTLCGSYEGAECVYRVHKTSPLLLSLLGDSRDYQH